MATNATELKKGVVIIVDGELYVVVDKQYTKPGKGGAFQQIKLKKLDTGQTIEKRFRSADRVETAFMDKVEMQYVYSTGDQHFFMDMSTYEQVPYGPDVTGDATDYLVSGTTITFLMHEGKVISVTLPNVVDLTITDTPPALKGATATNQYKPATLETGKKIMVPPFINPGETVRVDTRTGEYLERAK